MDLYTRTSYELSEQLTRRYSTSFTMASQLFSHSVKPHIYALYGLVRIADEIVDSYRQTDAAQQLTALQDEVGRALASGYSANPIVHAFASTARLYGIDDSLIRPFFDSMRTDLSATTFSQAAYTQYVYGSAEVVGLMCLKVFVNGDDAQYTKLTDGARALGAAYQKVNFLRDIASDYTTLGRVYFPGIAYKSFSEADKAAIIADITADFAEADAVITQLPPSSRRAVRTSYRYYFALLKKLQKTPIDQLLHQRVRITNAAKLALYVSARMGA